MLLTALHFNPMRALVWAAVVNGIVAVPVLVAMLRVASHPAIMGEFRIGRRLKIAGWLTTLTMAAGCLLMAVH